MSFLKDSYDLFLGLRSAHMGAHQYMDHKGMRDGKSMSGAKLWAEIESSELISHKDSLFTAEEVLLDTVADEIADYIPTQTAVLELGPGTIKAFEKKTLPLIKKLGSKHYICVDESRKFLTEISKSNRLKGIEVQPVEDDFFEDEHCYFDSQDRDALVCMFGSTMGNIVAPLSDALPQAELTHSLKQVAGASAHGWFLVSFDTDQDAEHVVSFYERQFAFQLNVFDRMLAELPVDANFDPTAFDYKAQWNSKSGQLAHIAIVNRDLVFKIGGKTISLRKGQQLHLKNSYKFPPSFFEECCMNAGLRMVKNWSHDLSTTKVYLLQQMPKWKVQPTHAEFHISAA